jgi:polygalacturonase
MKNKKKSPGIAAFLLLLALSFSSCIQHSTQVYNIADFGAVNSNTVFSTAAIQEAIDKCAGNGGGTVLVPPGKYLAGTLQLKSDVNLHLSPGATLIASGEIDDYPVLEGVTHGFTFGNGVQSFIYCLNGDNVSITGEGEIDLNGRAFVNNSAEPVFDFEADSLQRSQGTLIMGKRPSHALFFEKCTNISIRNIKISDSPTFTVSLSVCSVIEITGIFIDNNMRLPNNDGIHLGACSNAVISDCKVFAGDDCMAVTCLADFSKRSENIIVTNCIFSSFSAGVRVGYLKSKIDNVILSNLVISGSSRGIVIGNGTGGYVKNVNIQNCIIDTRIHVGKWWGNGEPIAIFIDDKVDSLGNYMNQEYHSPVIENITVSQIQSVSENGVHIIGNKRNIDNVFFNDCNFTIVDSYNRKAAGDFYDIQPGGIIKREKSTIASVYASGVNNLYFNNVLVINKLEKQKDFLINAIFPDCIVKKKEIEYVD